MGLSEGANVVAVGSGLAGGAAMWAADRWGGHPRRIASPPPTRTLVVAGTLGATVASGVGVVALHTRYALDLFGLVHVTYKALTITAPVLGLILVVLYLLGRRPYERTLMGPVGGALGAVALLAAPVGWYASFVAPYQLRLDRAELVVDAGRPVGDGLRIGVLSDIQTTAIGGYERDAVDRVAAQDPDLVLVAGDLFQSSYASYEAAVPEIAALLGRLDPPGGLFVVGGDTDPPELARRAVEAAGGTFLEDEVVRIEVAGQPVTIGGLRLDEESPTAAAAITELETAPGDELRILLAHRPEAVMELAPDSRVDLVVAGHTHGGQVALPFYGPPVILSRLPRHLGGGGLVTHAGNPLYVSTGVGMERKQAPQLRLGVAPSVGVIDVRAAG